MKYLISLFVLGLFMANNAEKEKKDVKQIPVEITQAMLLHPITVEYTNYKGEKGIRKIVPYRLWFGHTDYHHEDQWLLDVWDEELNAGRTYALKDISKWFIE